MKLHRRDSDDAPWIEIATPTYPPKPEGLHEREPLGQKPVPWNTELAWIVEPGHPDDPGVIWCGTIPGGLFRSDDRGASWTINESLWNHETRPKWFGGGFDFGGIHSISVDPRAAEGIAATTSISLRLSGRLQTL